MEYKITVERIEKLEEGQNYPDTTKLYEQRVRSSSETDIAEVNLLRKIINAVNNDN